MTETLPDPTVATWPKPSKYEQPANCEMFALALPRMRGYQSDLAHDMVRICNAMEGDVFLWIVRDHGTHIFGPEETSKFDEHIAFFRKHMPSAPLMAYRITVVSEAGSERGFPYVIVREVP